MFLKEFFILKLADLIESELLWRSYNLWIYIMSYMFGIVHFQYLYQNNLTESMSEQSAKESFSQELCKFQDEIDSEDRELDEDVMSNLQLSLTKITEFIENLVHQAEAPIDDTLFRFCGKYKGFELSPKNVICLLEKRIQRMMKNRRRKKNWNNQDTKILIWIVSKYVEHLKIPQIQSLKREDWKNISSFIPGSLPDSCMFKILNLKRTRLSGNKWSQEQAAILSDIASKSNKKNWRRISQKLYLAYQNENKTFRNAKQCKEHWVSFLNPELKKGSWDTTEDKILFQYILENSSKKRWSALSKIIKGRTQNALKNRYNIIIQRQRLKTDEQNEKKIAINYLRKLKLGINRSMYLNRKKPAQKDKKSREQSVKSEINSQVFKKQEEILENKPVITPEIKTQQQESINPQLMMTMPSCFGNGPYIHPVIINPNFFYLMPQQHSQSFF